MREKLPGDAGIFVTLSSFTEQARLEAQQARITLIDGRELNTRTERARRMEPCPSCKAPMILDRSTYGWWLRCERCPGKRDLGSDPGRALDLLIQR
jgi:ribosomal protein L37AE/L43A